MKISSSFHGRSNPKSRRVLYLLPLPPPLLHQKSKKKWETCSAPLCPRRSLRPYSYHSSKTKTGDCGSCGKRCTPCRTVCDLPSNIYAFKKNDVGIKSKAINDPEAYTTLTALERRRTITTFGPRTPTVPRLCGTMEGPTPAGLPTAAPAAPALPWASTMDASTVEVGSTATTNRMLPLPSAIAEVLALSSKTGNRRLSSLLLRRGRESWRCREEEERLLELEFWELCFSRGPSAARRGRLPELRTRELRSSK